MWSKFLFLKPHNDYHIIINGNCHGGFILLPIIAYNLFTFHILNINWLYMEFDPMAIQGFQVQFDSRVNNKKIIQFWLV